MKSRGTNLKRIAFVLALALAVLAPTAAMASQPEAEQFATYLAGKLPQQPTPAESGRAEAERVAAFLGGAVETQEATATSGRAETQQIATFLSGTVGSQPTSAESGRAEAKAFAAYLRASTEPGFVTPAESSRAETKAFANSMHGTMSQPQVAVDEPGGFDWADAGIGAAAMLGAVLLLAGLGAGLVISRHDPRREVPSA